MKIKKNIRTICTQDDALAQIASLAPLFREYQGELTPMQQLVSLYLLSEGGYLTQGDFIEQFSFEEESISTIGKRLDKVNFIDRERLNTDKRVNCWYKTDTLVTYADELVDLISARTDVEPRINDIGAYVALATPFLESSQLPKTAQNPKLSYTTNLYLAAIANADNRISQGDLAEKFGVTVFGISGVATRLEKRNILQKTQNEIEPNAKDLSLTPQYEDFIRGLGEKSLRLYDGWYSAQK